LLTLSHCGEWLKYTQFPAADFLHKPLCLIRAVAVLTGQPNKSAGQSGKAFNMAFQCVISRRAGFEFIPVFVREQLPKHRLMLF